MTMGDLDALPPELLYEILGKISVTINTLPYQHNSANLWLR